MTQPPARLEALNLERTVFFSDAVIAIAMTLLAIELPIPQGTTGTEVWHNFLHHLSGEYLSFIISFAVIAGFWFQHHRFFQYIERVSTRLMLWNLLSLFVIVLIPFATKLLSSSQVGMSDETNGNYPFGPVFYALMMLLWGFAYVMMVLAARGGNLWREGFESSASSGMIFGATSALSMFAVSIPIAFYDSGLAMLSWLLIPVVSVITGRLRARAIKKAAVK